MWKQGSQCACSSEFALPQPKEVLYHGLKGDLYDLAFICEPVLRHSPNFS